MRNENGYLVRKYLAHESTNMLFKKFCHVLKLNVYKKNDK